MPRLWQLTCLVKTAAWIRGWVQERSGATDVGQVSQAGPVRDWQGEVGGGQNLEMQAWLALHGEAELAVRHAGIGQHRQDRFGQPRVIHVPIPIGLVKPDRGGDLDADML